MFNKRKINKKTLDLNEIDENANNTDNNFEPELKKK